MAKRFICGLCALLLTVSFCLPAAAAASAPRAVGRQTEGEFSLGFRSDLSSRDLSHTYYYSDSFFSKPSTEYDHELATATLGLALAAFSPYETDNYYWVEGDVGREEHLAEAFDSFGFANAKFYNYETSLNTYKDYVAYGIAQKTISAENGAQTIFAVILRGGGYGCEWASNLDLGGGQMHEGFAASVDEVYTSLCQYIADARAKGELGEVKLWVGGYSRAGSVANLLAARIDREMTDISRENVYIYTIAAPAPLEPDSPREWRVDYNNNYNADGTLKSDWTESNIHNIIGSGDLVPQLPPAEWGYHRNGNDRFIPMSRIDTETTALNVLTVSVDSINPLDFKQLGTNDDVQALIDSMKKVFLNKSAYSAEYQQALVDMMECAFQRSEEEVVSGKVLDNDEIFERISSLSGMKQFSWDQKAKSVLLASGMARPLLERFGGNVPTRVQQVVTPLLATGLCYGIESDVLQLIAEYVVSIVSIGSAPQQIINVIKCHYPEAYITLMEYYPASEHKMKPYTKGKPPAKSAEQQ